MKITAIAILALYAITSEAIATVIVNSGFEGTELTPWYVDREFGSNRGWDVSSSAPHSGTQHASNLGRIELRQDFPAILGSQIQEFSFFASHQFPDRGNPWIEVFYTDGSSSGAQDISLDPSRSWQSSGLDWQWDKFNLLGFVDPARSVSGVSVVGIPNNVLFIDTFSLVPVPEPSSIMLLSLGGALTFAYRTRSRTRRRS